MEVDRIREQLKLGVSLFNSGRYFDAHEIWEELWKCGVSPYASLFKALAQLSVSLEHARRGNPKGAFRVGQRGLVLLREQRQRLGLSWLDPLLVEVERFVGQTVAVVPSSQQIMLPEELRYLPLEEEKPGRST